MSCIGVEVFLEEHHLGLLEESGPCVNLRGEIWKGKWKCFFFAPRLSTDLYQAKHQLVMAQGAGTVKEPKSFEALTPELSEWILDYTRSMGFRRTTPVQAMAIPLLMGNKDLVVEVISRLRASTMNQ